MRIEAVVALRWRWCMVFVLTCVGAALGRDLTASDLIYRVGDEAAKEARDASEQDQADSAELWRQWATRYWGHADTLKGRNVSLGQYLASNIEFSRRAAQQAARAGNQPAARFYDASARFWNDILQQLRAGRMPAIHFPKREMLTPIPGLPGTPWENMAEPGGGGIGQGAGRAPQGLRGQPAQMPVADPIPRPNYHWLHGARYTATAMAELKQWYARQKNFTPEQKQEYIRQAEQNNQDDEQREREWIKMTFGG